MRRVKPEVQRASRRGKQPGADRPSPVLGFNSAVRFTKSSQPTLQLRGFWEIEDGFVWSMGRWSELTFSVESSLLSATDRVHLVVDADVFRVPEKLDAQNVLVYLNGLRVGSYLVTQRTNFVIAANGVLRAIDNVLTLDTPDARRPADFGGSDRRELGLQLFSIRLSRMER